MWRAVLPSGLAISLRPAEREASVWLRLSSGSVMGLTRSCCLVASIFHTKKTDQLTRREGARDVKACKESEQSLSQPQLSEIYDDWVWHVVWGPK